MHIIRLAEGAKGKKPRVLVEELLHSLLPAAQYHPISLLRGITLHLYPTTP